MWKHRSLSQELHTMVKSRLRSLLLAASCLVTAPAGAQSLLLPGNESSQVTSQSQDTAGNPRLPAAGSHHIPFAEPTANFTLTGERDVEMFSFNLDAADAETGGALVLAYQNAVSVLPDDALMSVEVNGKPVGDFPIASPFNFIRQKIQVPAKLLRQGANQVRVSVSQHHRVDCSLDATYELWTRLSPDLSGFEAAGHGTYARFSDLYATGRQEDGSTEIRLVVPDKADSDMLDGASKIVQALALYLGRDDVVVSVADRPGDGPGIDLYAGVMGIDPATAGGMRPYAEAPYGLTIRPSVDPQRAAVILRAGSNDQMQKLLLEAVRGPMAAGLKAARDGKRFGVVQARAGEEFTLRSAGIRSTTFAGRLLRTHFDVEMPADFYAAEYGTFDLKLSAATAPGLNPASQMLVKVNGKIVNSFPFRNTDGQNFNGKLIELPLRAFRPGGNRIEMLAEVPDAGDAVCAPAARDEAKPRYVLLDTTSFTVPPLARVTRLPDLAAFSASAYPYGAGKPFNIFMRGADSHTASAAMTVLARLAIAAGTPLNGHFRADAAEINAPGDALVISANATQAQDYSRKTGRQVAGTFAIDDRAATLMKADLTTTASIYSEQTGDAGDQLIQAFEDSNANTDVERSWMTRVRMVMSTATTQFRSWLRYDDAKPARAAQINTLLTISQSKNGRSGGLVTEIRANSADDLTKGVRRLADSRIWNSLDGGSAIIDAKSMDIVTLQGEQQQFVEVTDQSFGNYRRIAAAWLSDNFQAYVVLVIALVGVFAAWLGIVVQRKGVRTAK
jgi:hypothetical protein